ncbi:MAG: molybdopterin cofactor-binding domain-containing protein [Bacteroidia bacterium]|nr:molybdopterin cofactor-binding domain-containing protein [Bacteroidia bacterium]
MNNTSTLNRRHFFKLLGSGIAVAVVLPGWMIAPKETADGPTDLASWIHIGENGKVTIFTGKVEVGQNIRTSLAQVVAEELRVSVETIHMIMGDTDLTPYDRGTFGSLTTPTMSPILRKAAAATRELLIEMAAEKWKVAANELSAEEGKIWHKKSGKSADFASLVNGKQLLRTLREEEPVTPSENWKIIGKNVHKINGKDFVTGRHVYTSDMSLPGMYYGKILRPGAWNSTLVAADTREAEAMPGVWVVKDGNFVGVVATSPDLANQALSTLKAEWKTPAQTSHREIFTHLSEKAESGGGRSKNESGSVIQGMTEADIRQKQIYQLHYIAHAPLEPRAALAQWEGDKLTVWTGTQRPFGVRTELAQLFQIAEEKIRVIMPDTGSGYGGKHSGEAALEAARLAKMTGKPVKIVWTREEEFTWAYFRPAGVMEVSAGIKKDGTLTAWEFHNYNSGGSGIRPLYNIPHQLTEYHPSESPLRQGSYRALASTANHFARESQIDELARSIFMDPLKFRLKNLSDERLLAVIKAVAEKFGWEGKELPANHGKGIACGFDKGGYVATCAEVSVNPVSGQLSVLRIVQAFECGAIINPEHLHSQVEGAIVQGLGGALFEAIQFEEGRILNPFFSGYRVPRFSDIPPIEIVLLDRRDLPSAGAGETPIVGVAPAIGNAIRDAAGIRLMTLPLVPDGVVKRDE